MFHYSSSKFYWIDWWSSTLQWMILCAVEILQERALYSTFLFWTVCNREDLSNLSTCLSPPVKETDFLDLLLQTLHNKCKGCICKVCKVCKVVFVLTIKLSFTTEKGKECLGVPDLAKYFHTAQLIRYYSQTSQPLWMKMSHLFIQPNWLTIWCGCGPSIDRL